MTRFPPLADSELDDDQRRMAGRAAQTGPYQAFVRAPLLWERLQPLRDYFARTCPLRADEREAAILVLARARGFATMAQAHHRLASGSGLSEAAIAAIGAGATIHEATGLLSPGAALAAEAAGALASQGRLSDELFARAAARWGERGVVDLAGLLGFFTTIGLTLNLLESASD